MFQMIYWYDLYYAADGEEDVSRENSIHINITISISIAICKI